MQLQRLNTLLGLIEETPNDTFLLFAVAKEYEKLGQTQNALAYYTQLREKDSNYVGLYYHLGKLYEQLRMPVEAIQTYRNGMQVAKHAGDQHAYAELAGALLNLTDDTE